jgi:eukaryotic-like serine/threonine-protein kinase
MKDPSTPPLEPESASPDRAEALFHGALQLPPEDRADYLTHACAGDTQLLAQVQALLHAHEAAQDFLEEPLRPSPNKTIALTVPLTEKPGDKIGRYKLLQQIGEGGCGVVYMAEQEEPVRRRVALKVIKVGMDTRQVVARFEAERQALALMDHPNIAKVLDAGATDTGRPFFVMELVRGIKITDYCNQNKLTATERLNLFVQICHALQHAHQKGIIHRDIKPSNILVTVNDGVPVPKVIDFGIAKATDQRLTDKTVFTAFEQFIGTPAYMSPEQAVMTSLDIDTRTDIYSLGVLLYELLTGQTPFDAKKLLASGLDHLRQIIREQDPERPSTRLRTMLDAELTATASHYRTEPPRLIHLLRGDLDWIVMKALEKDRTRRYETANGLAMDVERYLQNEPVLARPPSAFYRFQKLARRNKALFAGTAVGILALVVGLVVSLFFFVRAREALKRSVEAERNEKQLRQRAEAGAAESRQAARAGLLLMQGKFAESERALAGIPPHAALVPFYNVFGGVHARSGQWSQALSDWNLVVRLAPQDHMGYMYLAPLLLQVDDVPAYNALRAQILEHFGDTTDSRIAERMVVASLLLPPAAAQMRVLARMADVAVNTETNASNYGFNLFAKGLAEYRQGHYTNAVEFLKRVLPLDVGGPGRTKAYLVLAMAQWELGQREQSHDSLAEAEDLVKRKLPQAGPLGEDWHEWLSARVLMREAETLLGTRQSPASIPPLFHR